MKRLSGYHGPNDHESAPTAGSKCCDVVSIGPSSPDIVCFPYELLEHIASFGGAEAIYRACRRLCNKRVRVMCYEQSILRISIVNGYIAVRYRLCDTGMERCRCYEDNEGARCELRSFGMHNDERVIRSLKVLANETFVGTVEELNVFECGFIKIAYAGGRCNIRLIDYSSPGYSRGDRSVYEEIYVEIDLPVGLFAYNIAKLIDSLGVE